MYSLGIHIHKRRMCSLVIIQRNLQIKVYGLISQDGLQCIFWYYLVHIFIEVTLIVCSFPYLFNWQKIMTDCILYKLVHIRNNTRVRSIQYSHIVCYMWTDGLKTELFLVRRSKFNYSKRANNCYWLPSGPLLFVQFAPIFREHPRCTSDRTNHRSRSRSNMCT